MNLNAARGFDPDQVVMFALDDEDIETDLDIPKHDSFVGELPREKSLEDHVREEDEALVSAVTRLEIICEAFDSVDPSADAAELSLRKRVGALAMLANALRATCGFVLSQDHRELFEKEGLLEPYLSCVHMWTSDVTESLTEVARDLNALAPNWSSLRDRVEAGEWVYARAIHEQAKLERVKDALPEDLRAAVVELFEAFALFKRDLAEPFG